MFGYCSNTALSYQIHSIAESRQSESSLNKHDLLLHNCSVGDELAITGPLRLVRANPLQPEPGDHTCCIVLAPEDTLPMPVSLIPAKEPKLRVVHNGHSYTLRAANLAEFELPDDFPLQQQQQQGGSSSSRKRTFTTAAELAAKQGNSSRGGGSSGRAKKAK
jgi:hypothetical protein